ncbi:hypothetical protein P8452_61846 [Trifolium repens]|nr:hypothetical protein P8452_61846 [Trifolium repens]
MIKALSDDSFDVVYLKNKVCYVLFTLLAYTRNLYIGNLSRQVTRERLLNYFEGHGDVEECVLVHQYNKDLNISSRSGFVTYKTAEAAKNAIKDLDQSTLGGRNITVKYDLHNVEGGQPSVPARVALNANAPPYPMEALSMTPEYVAPKC